MTTRKTPRPKGPAETNPDQSMAITPRMWLALHMPGQDGERAWNVLEGYCRAELLSRPEGKGAMPALVFDGGAGTVIGIKVGPSAVHEPQARRSTPDESLQ